jgi:hypothetical protein
MTCRQVQKLSSPPDPPCAACSVSPAMARWKAWECRLGMPGSTGPAARAAACRPAAFGVTAVSLPSGPISNNTSAAQPSGSNADSAKSVFTAMSQEAVDGSGRRQ